MMVVVYRHSKRIFSLKVIEMYDKTKLEKYVHLACTIIYQTDDKERFEISCGQDKFLWLVKQKVDALTFKDPKWHCDDNLGDEEYEGRSWLRCYKMKQIEDIEAGQIVDALHDAWKIPICDDYNKCIRGD